MKNVHVSHGLRTDNLAAATIPESVTLTSTPANTQLKCDTVKLFYCFKLQQLQTY